MEVPPCDASEDVAQGFEELEGLREFPKDPHTILCHNEVTGAEIKSFHPCFSRSTLATLFGGRYMGPQSCTVFRRYGCTFLMYKHNVISVTGGKSPEHSEFALMLFGKDLAKYFPSTRIVSFSHVNNLCVMDFFRTVNKLQLNMLNPATNLNRKFVACRLHLKPTPELGFEPPITTKKKMSMLFYASGRVVILGCNRTDHVLQCARIAYEIAKPNFVAKREPGEQNSERVFRGGIVQGMFANA